MKTNKKLIALFILTLALAAIFFPSCAHEHTFNSWITSSEATCTTDGTEFRSCSSCEYNETRPIPAKGHNWRNATCTEAKKCTNCNAFDGKPLGHNYSVNIIKSATCLVDGVEEYRCSTCEDRYQTKISKTGHTNVLQSSGEDICSTCKTKTYSTYSARALCALYKNLKTPKAATINSIYAGKYNWENKNCIVVLISVTVGGTSKTYDVFFELPNGNMSFDLQNNLEYQADIYHNLMNMYRPISLDSYLENMNLWMEYTDKALEISKLKAYRTGLTAQTIEPIIDAAKKMSGVF